MSRASYLLIAFHILACLASAQEHVVVERDSVLRRTPSNTARIVTTVTAGQRLEVLRFTAPWYFVKTGSRTGWISDRHVLPEVPPTPSVTMRRFRRESDGPAPTSTQVTDRPSPFRSEPTDSEGVVIYVKNGTGREISFVFGRVPYRVPNDGERTITTVPGNYEFDVFAEESQKTVNRADRSSIVATVRSRMRDVKSFEKGHKYSWNIRVDKWYQTEN